MTTSPNSPTLDLHVLNAGYGESIVVHLPDGGWGVVDCCALSADDAESNSTVRFLRDQGVDALEFLCLTHPHADHYRGLSHFFGRFTIRYFWRPSALTPEALQNLLRYLKSAARGSADETSDANEFQTILRQVRELRKSNRIRVIGLCDYKLVYPLSVRAGERPHIEIWSIAPTSNEVDRYHESLKACFTGDGRLRPDIPRLRHNDVSAALLVRYGCTTILLGGDVEGRGWDDVLRQIDSGELAAHAVKVSHHGSRTGYTQGLWAAFGERTQPYAIIAPSRPHGLPHRDAVDHIAAFAGKVLATCIPAISFGQSPGDVPWGKYTLEAQIALRRLFPKAQKRRMEVGICSLSFDDQGNCISVQMAGPAGELVAT